MVIESKDAKKLRELDSKHAKKEVREAKIAFREHNLKEHQTLEKVRLG